MMNISPSQLHPHSSPIIEMHFEPTLHSALQLHRSSLRCTLSLALQELGSCNSILHRILSYTVLHTMQQKCIESNDCTALSSWDLRLNWTEMSQNIGFDAFLQCSKSALVCIVQCVKSAQRAMIGPVLPLQWSTPRLKWIRSKYCSSWSTSSLGSDMIMIWYDDQKEWPSLLTVNHHNLEFLSKFSTRFQDNYSSSSFISFILMMTMTMMMRTVLYLTGWLTPILVQRFQQST